MSQTIGVVLRCHRDAGIVRRIVEFVAPHVDELIVVADEVMSPEDLGIIAAARPTAFHRIPHLQPNERATAFVNALCSSDWIFRLCGDEVPSHKLLYALRDLVNDERVTNYRVPIAWLWPQPDTRLDRQPWWPDRQPRIFRTDPALCYCAGVTHSGFEVVGPHRLLDAPVLHLDLLITSEEERKTKIARYETERPGLKLGGQSFNQLIYFPGDATPRPATAKIGESRCSACAVPAESVGVHTKNRASRTARSPD